MIDVLDSETAVNVSGLSVLQPNCFIKTTAVQVKDGTVTARLVRFCLRMNLGKCLFNSKNQRVSTSSRPPKTLSGPL